MKEYSVSPKGNLLIYKKNYKPEFVLELIQRNNLNGLMVYCKSGDNMPESFDVFSEYTFLESLSFSGTLEHSYSFLHHLPNLKKLTINTWGKGKVDVSHQVNMELFDILWRPNVYGFSECKRLKDLGLAEFKPERDLSKIKVGDSLERLIIKVSSISSLNGIEQFQSLKEILLADCKKLTSFKQLNSLNLLESLEIDGTNRNVDFSTLTHLPNLKKLYLIDCGVLPSIKFLDNLPNLTEFGMLGSTVVGDGDLLPAQRIKNVLHKHKKHYNVKIVNKEYLELSKQNVAKFKEIVKKHIQNKNRNSF